MSAVKTAKEAAAEQGRVRVAVSLSPEEYEVLVKRSEREQRTVAALAKLFIMNGLAAPMPKAGR